jgi:hypothetical protein
VKNTFISLISAGVLLLGLMASCMLPSAAVGAEAGAGKNTAPDWREDYAYTMGVAAMHYTYPYLRMAHVRWNWTMAEAVHPEVQPNKALNTFWHAARLTDSDWTEGGAPNNDTVYSVAMLLVDEEPYILSVPPMERYYTFELAGMNSDNFAYVSELKHGRKGGHYALLPRGWKGQLPKGVVAVAEVPSPWVLVGGRTYVAGQDDIVPVKSLQQQYQVTPLSQWGKKEVVPPRPEVFRPYETANDPLATWKTINRMLGENPPVGAEVALMDFFKEVNIGPGMDVEALDAASKRGLARAAKDGLAQIRQAQMAGAGTDFVMKNGWAYSAALGRAGSNGDFLLRTVHQSYSGIVANDPEEAIYYGGYRGSDGQPLNGEKRYRIHLPAGSEPEVGAFWSITLYGPDANMVSNEIGRYSIGDRTPGLVRDEEGGLTIAVQAAAPADERVNWLPAPSGPFWMVLRAYQPGPSLLDTSWSPPQLSVVN